MTLAVYSKDRRIGRISLAGGKLTGTSPGIQDVADAATRRAGGDAAAAYRALAGFTNGYITVIPFAKLAKTREAAVSRGLGWNDAETTLPTVDVTRLEARDFHGRWTKGGAQPPGAGKAPHPIRDLNTLGMGSSGSNPEAAWEQDYVPPLPGGWRPDLTPAKGVKALTSRGRPAGAGTPDDPIDVRGDVHKALDLMAAGKNVRLNQPSEVALLLAEVAKISKATADLPKDKKPDWDFGLLTVKGTNLFTAQNKGIPRIDMPQFGGIAEPGTEAARRAGGPGKFIDLSDDVAAELRALGVRVTDKRVRVTHLRATQTQLTGSKVAGFAGAVMAKVPKAVAAMQEPIYVTRDGYVVDGHHRWATNMMLDSLDGVLGNDTWQNVHEIDMDIGSMIPWALDFGKRKGLPQVGNVRRALAWAEAEAERSFWNPRKHPRDTQGEWATVAGGDLRAQPRPGTPSPAEARQKELGRRAGDLRMQGDLLGIELGAQSYHNFTPDKRGEPAGKGPLVASFKLAADAMDGGDPRLALTYLTGVRSDIDNAIKAGTLPEAAGKIPGWRNPDTLSQVISSLDDHIKFLEKLNSGKHPDYPHIKVLEKATGIARGLGRDTANGKDPRE